MEKFMFWLTVILWLVVGGIALYRGESLPSANVWSVAGAFIFLYKIKKDRGGG